MVYYYFFMKYNLTWIDYNLIITWYIKYFRIFVIRSVINILPKTKAYPLDTFPKLYLSELKKWVVVGSVNRILIF